MKFLSTFVLSSFFLTRLASAEVLWDTWYTVTLQKKVPFEYYNEKVERKDGKVFFKTQTWRQEEGFINEEQVVSIAQNDENLTPAFFNFHQNYRDSDMVLDGSVKKQGAISTLFVKVRQNGKDAAPVQRQLISKSFFADLFAVWASKRMKTAKEGSNISFTTIPEDALMTKFSSMNGYFRLEKEDDFSKKTHTKKISVKYNELNSVWYLLPSGETQRIEMIDQKMVVEKTPENVARKFLIKVSSD